MDSKSLAKSKRSHSQHLSKKHNIRQESKPTSGSSAGAINSKKPSDKQVKEKTPSLPSNWDRYEEEFDSGSEDILNRPSDVVPKSKGADFGYLISQAQTDSFASLEDVLPEFHQGVGTMLSVRGQSILSWAADDNFIVDDKATPSVEVPFLSMNLHALAEQLAKIDLPQRLFIEADLLPPELRNKGPKESNDKKHAPKAAQQTAVKSDSNISVNREKMTEGSHQVSSLSNKTLVASDSLKDTKKQSEIAEAELDLLLDSFDETKLLDSYDLPALRNESLVSRFSSKATSVNAGFDDALDELLGDVPDLMNSHGGESKLSREINVQSSSSSVSDSKNFKVMDDFDLWLDSI